MFRKSRDMVICMVDDIIMSEFHRSYIIMSIAMTVDIYLAISKLDARETYRFSSRQQQPQLLY